jgi:CheY-like chemotaxis protein
VGSATLVALTVVVVTVDAHSGEFVATDASAVAAEFLGLLEGLGLQVCLGDVQMPVESARRLLRNLLRARLLAAPA